MTDRFSDVYGLLGELEHAIAIVQAAQDQITTLEDVDRLGRSVTILGGLHVRKVRGLEGADEQSG